MARPSDGYTTIMTTIAMYAMNVNTGAAKAGWDKVGFVGNLITDPNVLLVHNDSPTKRSTNLLRLVEQLKSR